MRRGLRIGALLLGVGLVGCMAPGAVAAPPLPIPQTGSAAPFVGAPATPDPFYAPSPPQHPFMAANGRSEIHSDAYQSDTYRQSGPLGRGMQVLSTLLVGDCGSVTFDSRGRIVSVCVGPLGPTLYMLDPRDLSTLASFALPPRAISAKLLNAFQDFGGGGYFYLDNRDRAIIPTTNHHVYVVGETAGGGFELQGDYDLGSVVSQSDQITSALPEWSGRIVFETFNGIVGTIDPASGAVKALALQEETENSFAVDETGGIFVVSIAAMYRLDLGPDGTPVVSWREVYPNSAIHEPGQVDAGSGTTPTVQGPYVTITDNANPLDVVVYRRARTVAGKRLVCVQPIFGKDAGADENSLIGAGNTMIAENNYGYTGPAAVELGGRTQPGIERVDINADGSGCHVVWRNAAERIPTVVSKLSLASGLIYSYTKDDSATSDPWYFTALDVHTGRVVYKQLAGFGFGYNNNYAPITIGPDGSAYVGVLGGLVEVRDATPPDVPFAQPPAPTVCACPVATGAARLQVRHRPGRFLAVRLIASGRGVRRVVYSLDGRRQATRTHRPFAARIPLGRLRPRTHHRLAAAVTYVDGGTARLVRTVGVPLG